ncbi:MAG: DNA cytosine methyltransferase [Methanomicrobia archaeon]|nr:DNA cytosine methyltransferase [Methanomicrobia archaeon]MBL7084237.1 DNA cytosine methyltransferase [Candidatus Aminicenantes bacterium]
MNFYAIDLFAGCGGLSEGFKQTGFDIIAQIEMDKWACESLRTRHLYHGLKDSGKGYLYRRYLRQEVRQEDILDRFPDLRESISHQVIQATLGNDGIERILEKIESSRKYNAAPRFHVLLGGPPCQPYSLAGRARDPFRMENDRRHYLYRHYLEILERLQPDFFLYENVPGLFTARAEGKEIFVRILNDFSYLDPPYEITPPLREVFEEPGSYILNSADFHIPQSRKRLILIGYKKSLEGKNPGIKNIFKRLQKQASKNREGERLTVSDAIGDLPPLKPAEGSDGWFGSYNSNTNLTSYQRRMRRGSPGIVNHRARTHMQGDLERYRFFIEHHKNGNGAACLNDLIQERPNLIPNHRHLDKFLDRFKVQWWDYSSSTITAHICKDGHYYIHPDINQCRSFTVREAARCQSFPDNFKFEGPRTEQFRQVGNAVPPLLAEIIGRYIRKELEKIYAKEIQSGE